MTSSAQMSSTPPPPSASLLLPDGGGVGASALMSSFAACGAFGGTPTLCRNFSRHAALSAFDGAFSFSASASLMSVGSANGSGAFANIARSDSAASPFDEQGVWAAGAPLVVMANFIRALEVRPHFDLAPRAAF